MKKILSLMLALAMLVSMVAVASAEDAAEPTTPTAPAFQTNVAVEIPAMATKPTFDGVINPDEWGEAVVHVSADTAATQESTEYVKENSFVWWNNDYENKADTYAADMAYDLWFGWDADNLYIAASYLDTNGYYCGGGRDSMWPWDMLQMYIDIYGANGIQANNTDDYDYTTTGFDWYEYEKPWSNAKVPNITAGKVDGLDRDMYQLYNVSDGMMIASRKADGTLNPNTQYDVNGDIYITPSAGGEDGKTVFEIAVPWAVISYDKAYDPTAADASSIIGVGKEIGFSCMMQDINGETKQGLFDYEENAFLVWGSGITDYQGSASKHSNDPTPAQVASHNGGSNALILTDKDVNGNVVADLPVLSDGGDVAFVEQVMYAEAGTDDNYGMINNTVKDEFTMSIDLAMLDYNINDPAFTAFGFVFGVDYFTEEELAEKAADKGISVDELEDADTKDDWAIYAGFDFGTSKATISHWNTSEGMTTTDEDLMEGFVYAQSEDEYDWAVGGYNDDGSVKQAEWKTLTVTFKDNKTTVFVDGEELVSYEDPTIDISVESPVIIYGTAERLYDNLSYSSGDKSYSYTFDSTDRAWHYGKDGPGLSSMDAVAFVCNDAENENLLGYTGHNKVEYAKPGYPEDEPTMGCLYCKELDEPAKIIDNPDVLLGDVNGDKIVNILDGIAIAKAVVEMTLGDIPVAVGDVDGNEVVNILDAIKIASDIVNG